jgi:hypothetical protein
LGINLFLLDADVIYFLPLYFLKDVLKLTDFAENIELRKIDFETKMYHLDEDINSILDDLDNCECKETIKKHIERISSLLEEYRRLQLCGIQTIDVDVQFLRYVNGLLFDKYFDMI